MGVDAAYLDMRQAEARGGQESGMLGCWCEQNTSGWDLPDLYSRTFIQAEARLIAKGDLPAAVKPDTRKFCASWWSRQYLKKALIAFFGTSAVFLNELIAYIFNMLGDW